MRTKLLAASFVALVVAAAAPAAVVLEKKSRQMPYVEVFGCQGVNAFVFRGPTGTSRRPIMVPPREYWTAQEAGIYSFVVRYNSGRVCSRLVTPEVFANYQVGDEFYDRGQPPSRYQTEDSKSVQPVVHQRTRTAKVRQKKHKTSTRVAAKHRKKKYRGHRIARR